MKTEADQKQSELDKIMEEINQKTEEYQKLKEASEGDKAQEAMNELIKSENAGVEIELELIKLKKKIDRNQKKMEEPTKSFCLEHS